MLFSFLFGVPFFYLYSVWRRVVTQPTTSTTTLYIMLCHSTYVVPGMYTPGICVDYAYNMLLLPPVLLLLLCVLLHCCCC